MNRTIRGCNCNYCRPAAHGKAWLVFALWAGMLAGAWWLMAEYFSR